MPGFLTFRLGRPDSPCPEVKVDQFGCCDPQGLPSCARLGRARAPVPTRARERDYRLGADRAVGRMALLVSAALGRSRRDVFASRGDQPYNSSWQRVHGADCVCDS